MPAEPRFLRRARVAVVVVAIGAVAIGAVAIGAGGPAVRTVELTIRHSRFVPAVVEVAPGERVRFVVRNDDPIDHELIIGPDAVQAAHERGTESHHRSKPGEVSVPAGATRSTTYAFPATGAVPMGCHLPGHFDYGMKGMVRIRAT